MALSETLQQTRMTCESLGLIYVDGAISFDKRYALLSPLEWQQAIDILQKCPPKIVYIDTDVFAFEDELSDDLKEAAAFTSAPVAKAIISLKKTYSKYEGQPQAIFLSFVIDGVLHVAVEEEPWFSELESRLTELTDDLAIQRETIATANEGASDAHIRQNGQVLAARPEFRAGKSSFEKRVFLARNVYPDLDAYTCQRITTEADNVLWLESVTPK